jgi:hypothetical protein
MSKCVVDDRLTVIKWEDGDADDPSIARVGRRYPNLRTLDISGSTRVHDGAILSLARKCHKLTDVVLSGCSALTNVGISALASNCPQLHLVDVSRCSLMTDAGITALAHKCKHLRYLYMSCTTITDVGLGEVARRSPKLTHVDVSNCSDIHDTGVCALGRNCHALVLADVGWTGARDVGVIEIARNCPNMQWLGLANCFDVTDRSVVMLAQKCPDLRYINLSFTDVSAAGIATLRQSCFFLDDSDIDVSLGE